jgi:multidrug efflux system outer membrane protein
MNVSLNGQHRLRWFTFSQKANTLFVALLCFSVALSVAPPAEAKKLPETKNEVTPVLQGKLEWSAAKQNPENPSSLQVTGETLDKQWWTQFHDELLTGYINQAFTQNHQVAIAKARISEARANSQTALSSLFPTVNFSPTFLRQKTSANQFPSFGGGGASGIGLGSFALKPYNIISLPVQATYEVDFFMKNVDKVKSANKQLEASVEDYRTATIALVTDVSNAYFNLMSADKQIQLQKEAIALSEADLAAAHVKLEEGLIGNDQVAIKEAALTEAKANLQDYYRLQAIYSHQMATLLGRPAEVTESLPRNDFDSYTLPASIDAGIPSTLITRRPDILSAENLLEASQINVTVARKEFLPTLTINGSMGLAATLFENLFKTSSKTWSMGGGLTQGLFKGGAKVANLKVNKARYEAQLHQYQQTILTSLQEVNDSMASLKARQSALEHHQASNAALQKQLGYQQIQLDEGAVSASDLYPTRLQLVQSNQGLVQAKLLGLTDTLNLYKALGGGY